MSFDSSEASDSRASRADRDLEDELHVNYSLKSLVVPAELDRQSRTSLMMVPGPQIQGSPGLGATFNRRRR